MDNPSELLIQKEILRNGAVITDWVAPPYFKTYKNGVFDRDGGQDLGSLDFSAG